MIYNAEYNNLPTLDELVDNLNYALAQQPVLHLNPLERLVQRRDCFVVTRLMSGRYSLKPNIGYSCALFRGESTVHPTCKPVFLRNWKDRCTIENIKRNEFELLLNSHPIYQLFREGIQLTDKLRFIIENPYGIAMSYGFPTQLLSLTSDINIASFFAVTEYDEAVHKYKPIDNSENNKTGILYVFNLMAPFGLIPGLSTVGLQPFVRPGLQKEFAINLAKDADFKDHRFTVGFVFKHDNNISQRIYDRFNQGEAFRPHNDILTSKARQILDSKEVSIAALERNLHQNPRDSRQRIEKELNEGGINVVNKQHPYFSNDDLAYIYDSPTDYWTDFCKDIEFSGRHASELKDVLLNVPLKDEYRRFFEPNQ